jgi:hypothetical protein
VPGSNAMTKPKAKAKPKTKREPPPLVLTTAECGYSYTVSVNPDERTPYKHPCTCSILYSSSAVCHECSCSLCADSRALRTPKLSDLELLKRKLASAVWLSGSSSLPPALLRPVLG